MNFIIIEYTELYKEQLINFILSIQKNEFHIDISREEQPDLENIYDGYIKNGGQFWLALNKESHIIGTIGLLKLKNGNSALKKMFVDEKFRNIKVGKKLLEKVVKKCREDMISTIYLGTIDKFVSAQFFYSNNGFKKIKSCELPSDFPKLDVDNRFYFFRCENERT